MLKRTKKRLFLTNLPQQIIVNSIQFFSISIYEHTSMKKAQHTQILHHFIVAIKNNCGSYTRPQNFAKFLISMIFVFFFMKF